MSINLKNGAIDHMKDLKTALFRTTLLIGLTFIFSAYITSFTHNSSNAIADEESGP